MGSDPNLTKVDVRQERRGDAFDRLLRAIQTVGFPIVVAAFLLWEWHYSVNNLNQTMTEVRILLSEIKSDFRRTHGGNSKDGSGN